MSSPSGQVTYHVQCYFALLNHDEALTYHNFPVQREGVIVVGSDIELLFYLLSHFESLLLQIEAQKQYEEHLKMPLHGKCTHLFFAN